MAGPCYYFKIINMCRGSYRPFNLFCTHLLRLVRYAPRSTRRAKRRDGIWLNFSIQKLDVQFSVSQSRFFLHLVGIYKHTSVSSCLDSHSGSACSLPVKGAYSNELVDKFQRCLKLGERNPDIHICLCRGAGKPLFNPQDLPAMPEDHHHLPVM